MKVNIHQSNSTQIRILQEITIEISNVQDKEGILKTTREKKQITYKRDPIHLVADFAGEILQAKRRCNNVFRILKKKISKILYPAKLFFRNERQMRTFPEIQNLRTFIAIRPVIQETLIKVIQIERKGS